MANRDILAIGTSAGGFEALRFLASRFPADLPASVFMVIHLSSAGRSVLDEILTEAGPLRATFAEDGERFERGRIYIARPGRHLIVDGDELRLGSGPRENNTRPAIDPLFRSLALCCGPRSVGVVLTGMLGDGSSGLQALQKSGGITVVQDPNDADFPDMPMAAIKRTTPDHVTHLANMPELLLELLRQPRGKPRPVPDTIKYEVEVATTGRSAMSAMDRIGQRSVLACPDCGGVMWEIDEGGILRYRCHVGHAYSAEVMSLALDDSLRRALGSALRALDERIALTRKLERQAINQGSNQLAASWAQKAAECEKEAQVIRQSIQRADEIGARVAAE
jgi:two-component system chemotaxis response regulator CheB